MDGVSHYNKRWVNCNRRGTQTLELESNSSQEGCKSLQPFSPRLPNTWDFPHVENFHRVLCSDLHISGNVYNWISLHWEKLNWMGYMCFIWIRFLVPVAWSFVFFQRALFIFVFKLHLASASQWLRKILWVGSHSHHLALDRVWRSGVEQHPVSECSLNSSVSKDIQLQK